jgi:alkylation response protein AidB-like acyl-CoA dehydrogenase
MDFGLNDDQETLARYARDFLTNEAPSTFVRAQMDGETAHDAAFYKKMAELGWTGIAIPEAYGGQGMSYVDVGVLVEEMGRALVPGPFFSTVCLATPAIVEAGTEDQKAKLLGDIAAGQRLATVAYTEPGARLDASGVQLAATPDGDSFVLNGKKSFVPDAHVADTLIVAARTSTNEDGITLFVVDANADGVSIEQLKTMDMTRRWCEISFDGVKVDGDAVMGAVDTGWAHLENALRKSIALICAESVGGAQKVLDLSVEYSKVRVQFGRPIGSFQGVKHKCADMLVDVEMARSAMYYAAWAASDNEAELPLAASVAKAYCGDAYSRVALTGILVHGGIGFTWEHDMHLYYKRAKANELLLGDPAHHREIVAKLIAA